jgi:hypothetical protein
MHDPLSPDHRADGFKFRRRVPIGQVSTMDGDRDTKHYVKRVVLPSGKTIEVVYFKDAADRAARADGSRAGEAQRASQAEEPARAEPSAASEPASRKPALVRRPASAEPDQRLHVCLECSSGLVHPVEWEEAGGKHWSVLLHCPNCHIYRDGVFSQTAVEAFDEELERGADALARDYKRLMHSNMAEETERFAAALRADAILPEDF